jgi:pimeloyl-ACP methyl ester carboxylesterase
MTTPSTSGYAPVNGMEIYWESHGAGGTPLVLVHPGFGVASSFGELAAQLSVRRQVIAVELQAHGHTRDIDRPFSYQAFGDDIAGVLAHLGIDRADLLGYSLGGGVCLRAVIQHPERVRRVVLVSTPYRSDGWFSDVRDQMALVGPGIVDQLTQSPVYAAWVAVAPDVGAFPSLVTKTGDLVREAYDWTDEVSRLRVPTMLVYGDADSMPPAHCAEFFALLGGGLRDAGWDGAPPTPMRLAILPGRTHYDVAAAPELATMVDGFLG